MALSMANQSTLCPPTRPLMTRVMYKGFSLRLQTMERGSNFTHLPTSLIDRFDEALAGNALQR